MNYFLYVRKAGWSGTAYIPECIYHNVKDNIQDCPEDARHINLKELEGIVKGENLALLKEGKELEVLTDSRREFGWIKDLVTEECRNHDHGLHGRSASPRRLGLFRDIIQETRLQVVPSRVNSQEIKTDELNRVFIKNECSVSLTSEASLDRHCKIHKSTGYMCSTLTNLLLCTRSMVS